jgi:hypothetical protein
MYRRKQLHHKYLIILDILYSYRFGTKELFAQALGMTDTVNVYRGLELLVREGYVGKLYDSKQRLLGKPAVYSLSAKGHRYLEDLSNEGIGSILLLFLVQHSHT